MSLRQKASRLQYLCPSVGITPLAAFYTSSSELKLHSDVIIETCFKLLEACTFVELKLQASLNRFGSDISKNSSKEKEWEISLSLDNAAQLHLHKIRAQQCDIESSFLLNLSASSRLELKVAATMGLTNMRSYSRLVSSCSLTDNDRWAYLS